MVEFKTPDGIVPIPAVTLAPESEQKIVVTTAQDFLANMDSQIALRSDAYVAEIPVRVYSAPPVLKITTEAIDFRTIEAGREYRQKFELTNTGGSDARIFAKSGEDLLVIPDPDTVVLAPGHSRKFEMVVQTMNVGELRETVQIGAGVAKPVAVSVQAQVVAPKKPVEDSSSAVGIPLVATMEPPQPEGSLNPADLGDARAIDSARLIKRTPWRVVLSWKKPAGKVGGYLIEGRYLLASKNGGQPEIKWETWKGRHLSRGGRSRDRGHSQSSFRGQVVHSHALGGCCGKTIRAVARFPDIHLARTCDLAVGDCRGCDHRGDCARARLSGQKARRRCGGRGEDFPDREIIG